MAEGTVETAKLAMSYQQLAPRETMTLTLHLVELQMLYHNVQHFCAIVTLL